MHQVELDLENAVRELSLCECPANVHRKDLFIGGNAWRLVLLVILQNCPQIHVNDLIENGIVQ